MRTTALFFCVAAFCGCVPSTVEERARARTAVEASKQEPAPSCRLLGAAEGRDSAIGGPPEYEIAFDDLKAQALKRGANYAVIDSVGMAGDFLSVRGRVFACPAGATASVGCIPDCSPGYVCVSAHCVSACNPPCESGQRCGADKMCYVVK